MPGPSNPRTLSLPVIFPDGIEDIEDVAVGDRGAAVFGVGRDDHDGTRLDGVRFALHGELEGAPDDRGDLLVGMGMLRQRRAGLRVPAGQGHELGMHKPGREAGNHLPFSDVFQMDEGHGCAPFCVIRVLFPGRFGRLGQEELLEGLVMLDAEGFLEPPVGVVLEIPLHEPQGRQGRLKDFPRQLDRPLQKVAVFHDLAHEADPVGLPGVDSPPRQAKIPRQAVPDQPAQRREERRDAELDLGVPEGGRGRADSQIADRRKVESTRHGGTVHGGDHRLGKVPDVPVIPRGGEIKGVELIGLAELLQIETGAEGGAGPRRRSPSRCPRRPSIVPDTPRSPGASGWRWRSGSPDGSV